MEGTRVRSQNGELDDGMRRFEERRSRQSAIASGKMYFRGFTGFPSSCTS